MSYLNNIALRTLSASAIFLAATSAQAFSVDYVSLAAGNEGGHQFHSYTDAGVTVTASGTSVGDTYGDNTPDYYAYLDDLSGGQPAGLGVCKAINGSAQCTPSSDDNVTYNEALTLSFSQDVTLSNIVFRNGSHGTTFTAGDGLVDISVDGGSFQSYSLTHNFTLLNNIVGSQFTFIGSTSQSDDDQFYISSLSGDTVSGSVPVPAPLALFGLGLLGMGYRRLA